MDLILILVALFITIFASIILRIVYFVYKRRGISSGYTGKMVAKEILKKNNLEEIDVGMISGELTDYYNNRSKEIRLSTDIYEEASIASVAVAAHECGHAIQYKDSYFPIKIRNFLVPIVNIGNSLGYIVIVISLAASLTKLFILGIILISFAIIFQLITLPVEINASKRGKKQLVDLGIIKEDEKFGVTIMLAAAAFTYLAGLLSSLLQILRLVYIFANNDKD